MKRIALIPALLGSTRIPDKNLLLIDGAPLAFYVASACKEAGVFDAVYLNSEHAVFGNMARWLGVSFYHRQPERGGSTCRMKNQSRVCEGTRCQTHDHFLFDFMAWLGEPCLVVLVHTTSPLLRPETLRAFVDTFERDGYDSLLSMEERSTESFFQGRPLNFSMKKKDPTQTLSPVQLITWALSGWNTASFMAAYQREDSRQPGPTFCGKSGVFPLDRIQALDADTWDDLYLIEACLQHRRQQERPGQFRFTSEVVGIERCLEELIGRDGVGRFEGRYANSRFSNLEEIKQRMGPPPWLYLLVSTPTDQIALICQRPGEGCRNHCHVTHAEWWIVLEGAFEWRLGDGTVLRAKASDVVCLPRGMPHTITCVGEDQGIRMACGARDMEHVYLEPGGELSADMTGAAPCREGAPVAGWTALHPR